MPKLNPNRQQEFNALLSWLKANLVLGKPIPVRRDQIAQQSGVATGYVSKSVLVLTQKGYLRFDDRRSSPTTCTLLRDLSEVTPADLDQWVYTYQKEHDQANKLKKRQLVGSPVSQQDAGVDILRSTFGEPNPAAVVSTPPELPLESLVTTLEPIPEVKPEPTVPLSPMQQLLQQVQQLAENEAAREAKQPRQPSVSPEVIDSLEARLKAAEGKLNTMLYFFQQSAHALRGLAPVELPEPLEPKEEEGAESGPSTTRTLLTYLVNSYAAAERRTEHDTWKYLYGQLSLRTGFNPYAHASSTKSRNYLSVVKQNGHLDTMYELAKKLFVLPELK